MSHDRDRVEIYQDSANRWRWRYVAGNGEIVADSGQSYSSRSDAITGADQVTGFKFRSEHFRRN